MYGFYEKNVVKRPKEKNECFWSVKPSIFENIELVLYSIGWKQSGYVFVSKYINILINKLLLWFCSYFSKILLKVDKLKINSKTIKKINNKDEKFIKNESN